MIEASGIGWQGRAEQADLIAAYLAAERRAPDAASAFRARADAAWPDLSGGYRYLGLERMSYYVNKDAYRRTVKKLLGTLPAASARSAGRVGRSAPVSRPAERRTGPTGSTGSTAGKAGA
jgi:hypothetical protein